ncbi:MAG: hypothetical protein ABF264_06520 [Flavobacteriales bacterium]
MKNIIYGILFLFASCQCERAQGISENIKYAKQNGVIVKEIINTPTEFIFMDSIRFEIKEAWIEKIWSHECYKKIETFENFRGYSYQLCINTTKESLTKYREKWEIGDSKIETFRLTSWESLVVEINQNDFENKCYKIKSIFSDNPDKQVKSNLKFCIMGKYGFGIEYMQSQGNFKD